MASKNMFLIYHGRFPSEKAASLFAAKSAETFANEGLDVTLIVPKRLGRSAQDPSSYYGIENNFKVTYVPTIDLFFIPFFKTAGFYINFIAFSISTYFYLHSHAKKEDIIYSNETLPLYLASFSFKNTFYELHDFPESKRGLFKMFILRMKWILAHNMWKSKKVAELFNVLQEKILSVPNAVDIQDFDIDMTKALARQNIDVSQTKKIVMYTGHLYGWKGVDTLAEAALKLPKDYLVIFVGGTDSDIERFKQSYGNDERIYIAGHQPHQQIPMWQKAADILVLPNTATEDISKYYTSPMKLFEYMASRKPIIASQVPSIEEIVTTKHVVFFRPDDANSLAHAIQTTMSGSVNQYMTEEAFKLVQQYTWKKRAEKILRFIGL